MLKALLKKQLLELNQFYFTNRKTGKARTKGGVIGMMILFVFLFLFIAASIFASAGFLCSALESVGLTWLYFALYFIAAVFLGVFGSVFNTYAGLYLAKDNELLLSMPIKPMNILFSRMVGVGAMSLLYSGIIWIPAVIAYWIFGHASAAGVIFQVILILVITALVVVLTCILGWVVAKVSVKLKRKNFVSVIITVAFFGVYYYFSMSLGNLMTSFLANSEMIGSRIKSFGYPLYLFGQAAAGEAVPMIIVVIAAGLLLMMTVLVLSRSFLKIVTSSKGTEKTEYKEKASVQKKAGTALFHKELKRFVSSSTYMLNTGLGLIILPVMVVAAAFYSENIRDILSMIPGINGENLIAPAIAAVVGMVASLNAISAPSVSLEGKNIWILQSMPIDSWTVLKAKMKPHIIINEIDCLVCSLALGIIFNLSIVDLVLVCLLVLGMVVFSGAFGVMMNLIKPNLNWTNETIVIKQSMSVMISLLGGFVVAAAVFGLSILAAVFLNTTIFILCMIILLAAAILLVLRWLKRKGTKIFARL